MARNDLAAISDGARFHALRMRTFAAHGQRMASASGAAN